LGFWVVWTALVSAGFTWSGFCAEEKPRTRPIEFSEPSSSEVTTNLQKLGAKRDGLKRLEEDLFKPLKNFNPENPGDVGPQFHPPTNPIRPDKRTQEAIERRKNWIFMSPEEWVGGPSASEVFHMPEYGADGQEKRKLSPIEKFYESLGRREKNVRPRNQTQKEQELAGPRPGGREENGTPADNSASENLTESERALKKLFEKDSPKNAERPLKPQNLFSDIFGLGKTPPTLAEIEAQKARMDDFKKMLGVAPVPGIGTEFSNPLTKLPEAKNPLSINPATAGLTSLPLVNRPQTFNAQVGFTTPGLSPGISADSAFKSPSSSFQPSVVPIKPPPARITPTAPTFLAPNRAF
jgi:hypothetical protein